MMVRAAPRSSGPDRLRLVLPGILGERPRALRFIIGACRAHAPPSDVEHALVSAFGEAFNHAVVHGDAQSSGTVTVEVEVAVDYITVTVRDRGASFDMHGGDPSTLTERRYGLFIILRAMDEVRWYRQGDENVVALSKRIPTPVR
jgi:anti-sigma regulatory factor (Ser/Thr protein kinase)